MKLELLTKATVVYDAIRFVSERTKKDRLISEEEESQTTAATAAAAAATAATTHQVFKWSRDVHTQTYQNTCKITMAGRWFIAKP